MFFKQIDIDFFTIFMCLIKFTHLFQVIVTDLNRVRLSVIVVWVISKFHDCGIGPHGIIMLSSALDSRAIIIHYLIFYNHYYCGEVHNIIIFIVVAIDCQWPGADHVAVQSDRLLRQHQITADVHAPVLVRRQHDGCEEPRSILRRRAAQTYKVRRGWTQPRRLLHPPRCARHLHAIVFRHRARFTVERGGQLRLVHRKRRTVFWRRSVICYYLFNHLKLRA